MTTETIHPDSIETKAHAIRDLGMKITEVQGPETEEVKRTLIKKFARKLKESGRAPEIAEYLYNNAPDHLETQPGHWYGVYVQSEERGRGRLFTVQKILANSGQTPMLDQQSMHKHPMPETMLLVEGRIRSIMEIGGKRIVFETQPLTPHEIPAGIPHGVSNPGPIDAIGFCIR